MASPAGHCGGAPQASTSKGKAIMDEAAEEAEGVFCGICLTDSRRAIRGELDCCAHHFCFVCIMAWGRVESRCPFCKARFRTIRRPPVPGRFPSERLVAVAERNQVYNPWDRGNESSTGNIDPYATTNCSVCDCSSNEELLLLCELCDVAAHSYCVGLGSTVPEGDWFCNDCMTSKEEHSRCQIDEVGSSDQAGFEITFEAPVAVPVAAPSVSDVVDEGNAPSSEQRTDDQQLSWPSSAGSVPSIYDIVGDDYDTSPVRRTNLRSTMPGRKAKDVPLQSTSAGCRSPESSLGRGSVRAPWHDQVRLHVERARTLRNSRNLTNRIKALRENWSALREGSVGFSTHQLSSTRGNGTGTVSLVTQRQQCAKPMAASSTSGAGTSSVKEHQQSAKASTSGLADKISPKETRRVEKAWKMLAKVTSAGGKKKSNKPSPVSCSIPFSMGNRACSDSPIDAILGQMNQSLSYGVTQKSAAICDHSTKRENTVARKNFEEHRSNHVLVHESTVSSRVGMVNQESPKCKVASSSHSRHADQRLESLCGAVRSEKPKSAYSLSSGRSMVISPLPLVSSARSLSTATVNTEEPSSTRSQSTPVVTPGESSAVCIATSDETGTSGATAEVKKSSGPDSHGCKRKLHFDKSDHRGSKKSRSSCKIAKSEISELAIRELKLLKIDKTHGSERFKEVARTATHTVLASCGFEHSASLALPVSRPVCKHSSRIKPLKSSPVANTCRECLRDFVKEVISSDLSGSQMDQTAPSC